jgi:hypothetical protein
VRERLAQHLLSLGGLARGRAGREGDRDHRPRSAFAAEEAGRLDRQVCMAGDEWLAGHVSPAARALPRGV